MTQTVYVYNYTDFAKYDDAISAIESVVDDMLDIELANGETLPENEDSRYDELLALELDKIEEQTKYEISDIDKLDISDGAKDILKENALYGGKAWKEAIETPDMASEMAGRAEIASFRHQQTDYDKISKTGLSDEDVSDIRKDFNKIKEQ